MIWPEVDANVEVSEWTVFCALLSLLDVARVRSGYAVVLCPADTKANQPVHVIAFGAHPDDCDLGAGRLAVKYAALGNKLKFVSLNMRWIGPGTDGKPATRHEFYPARSSGDHRNEIHRSPLPENGDAVPDLRDGGTAGGFAKDGGSPAG